MNIPPLLNKGKLTESEVRATKEVAHNHIHVERGNARIKGCRILNMIPSYLRSSAKVLVELCCVFLNLQQPLIKEIGSTLSVTQLVTFHSLFLSSSPAIHPRQEC